MRARSWCAQALALASRRRPCDCSPRGEAEAALVSGAGGRQLRRRLTAFDLTLVGVGASVGSGIFVIVGIAVQPTGPGVCLSFLFAAIASIFSALCYAELAARIPFSGSVYLYAYVAFGEFIALLFGLNVLVDYHVGAALGTLSCANYLRAALVSSFSAGTWLPSVEVISVLLLVSLTVSLCVGVETGLKKINGLLVSAKVLIVLVIVAVGTQKIHPQNLEPFLPYGWLPVISTSATCSFAYIGFGTVANAVEECVNPQRDVPVAITTSLLICAMLYVGFALVLCGMVPFHELDKSAPVSSAFGPHYANVPWVNNLVTWGAILGIYTTLLTGLYSQARIYLAMARDGLFFKSFEKISVSVGTPVRAQILCGILAGLLCLGFHVDKLSRMLNIGVLASYTVVCAGVLVLRAERPTRAAASCTLATIASMLASVISAALPESGNAGVNNATHVALVVAVAISCVPMLRCEYSAPPTTFACPLCPFLPALGIVVNGYMLSQCHWEAWVRFVATTVIILIVYAIRVTITRVDGAGVGDMSFSQSGLEVPPPASQLQAASTS